MKLSIEKKVIAGFALIIALIVLITTGVYINTHHQVRQSTRVAHRYHQSERTTLNLFLALRNQETAVRQYLLTRDDQCLEAFQKARQNFRRGQLILQDLLGEDQEALEILKNRIIPVAEHLDTVLAEVERAEYGDTDARNYSPTFSGLDEEFIQAELKFYYLLNQRHAEAMFAQVYHLEKNYITKMSLIILLALVAFFVGIMIARSITTPLRKLMKGIKIIKSGIYRQIDEVCSNDEVGDVVEAFNQMVATIEANETLLQNRNEELQAQSEELSAQNGEIMAQQTELEEVLSKILRQEQLMSSLFQFTKLLTRTINLDRLANLVLNALSEEAQAETGTFLLPEKAPGNLRSIARLGSVLTEKERVWKMDEGPLGTSIREGRPVAVQAGTGVNPDAVQGLSADENHSELYLPLIYDEHALGLIILTRKNGPEFSGEDQSYLKALADQTAVALRNALYHQDVKEALTESREIEKMKTELINTVSHELRTPLTSILGFTELLLNRNPGGEQAKKFITTIYQETARLSNLVDDFLDLQRIENRRMEYYVQPFDLSKVIKNAIEIYRGQSDRHTINLQLEQDLPLVKSDPERVAQVLGNLLSNAVKYSPQGGAIEIRASSFSPQMVVISVQDHGLGLPEREIGKIFQPFYRVDNSDRREIGGTGLGLAIAYQTVQALGGELWVESQYRQGSEFSFTLPVVESVQP